MKEEVKDTWYFKEVKDNWYVKDKQGKHLCMYIRWRPMDCDKFKCVHLHMASTKQYNWHMDL